MLTLRIDKVTDSHVSLGRTGQRIFAFSEYDVEVFASEFKGDVDGRAFLLLEKDGVAYETAELVADNQRRGRRTGVFRAGSSETAHLFGVMSDWRFTLRCVLSGNTLFKVTVPLEYTPVPDAAGGSSSAEKWTVVDIGDAGSTIRVADLTQVKVTVPASASGVCTIVPLEGGQVIDATVPYEAFVVFTTQGGFPFEDVSVNGVPPVWERKDSFLLSDTKWTLHLMSVAGEWHASLRVHSSAPGAENDPDGDAVVSMEVNNVA